MLVLNILYQIFIAPIEMGMEWFLEFSYTKTGSYGWSLVLLSLVVNIVLLPLYNLAEAWQQEEREKQNRMVNKIKEIKKVFKGQERFMMLKTLYRQNDYHPLLAARNSIGFLIQIPFFFAAFHLLSNYTQLNGQSFGLFADLGKADGLIPVGSWHIHLMPFVMTAINLASAYIYASELAKKDKIQLYGFALFFLIVLYASPVALVFYWTMNNVFSLGKNWIYKKLDKPKNKHNTTNDKQVLTVDKTKLIDYRFLLYLSITSFVIALYSHILYKLVLPNGINREMTLRFRIIFAGFFLLFLLGHFIFKRFFKNKLPINNKSNPKLRYDNSLLLILPLALLLHYSYLNHSLVDFSSIYTYITIIIVLIGIVALIFSKLVKKTSAPIYAFVAIISLSYLLLLMPKLAGYFKWTEIGSIQIQLLTFAAITSLVFLLLTYQKKLLYLLLVVYLSTEVYSGITDETAEEAAIAVSNDNEIPEQQKLAAFENIKFKKENPVYFLTYDAYPNIETHELYGIENNKQIERLKNSGFNIYNGTYSMAGGTVVTLSATLAISPMVRGIDQRVLLLGESFTHKVFKANGYKTAAVYPGTMYTTDFIPTVDEFYPKALTGNLGILNAWRTGEFKEDLQFNKGSHKDFEKYKRELISKGEKLFIQTHEDSPGHNSLMIGKCPDNNIGRYKDRLVRANKRMNDDLEVAFKRKDAIIIIAGDHGPFLTKNCRGTGTDNIPIDQIDRLDVQDRYGAFVAIKWPEKHVGKQFPIQTVQDIIPAVFSFLADDNSLYEKLRTPSITFEDEYRTSGVNVNSNILTGGVNDGEPLFLNREIE